MNTLLGTWTGSARKKKNATPSFASLLSSLFADGSYCPTLVPLASGSLRHRRPLWSVVVVVVVVNVVVNVVVPTRPLGFLGDHGNGNGNVDPSHRKPEDLCAEVHLTLSQVYTGCTCPVTVRRSVVSANIYGVEERSSSTETIYVEISEGTDHDENIRVRARGHRFHGLHGDVCVRAIVEGDETGPLQRRGLDMIYNKSISPARRCAG